MKADKLLVAIGRRLVADRPLAAVDLETTGVLLGQDRIVEISIRKLHVDREPWSVQAWSALINPGIPIPAVATAVHGITDATVADAQPFEQLAPTIAEILAGCDLIGYNIRAFDWRMLVAEFERVGVPHGLNNAKVIDAYRIFQRKEPRNLSAALAFYCDAVAGTAHRAETDVVSAIEVLHAQLERYGDVPNTVGELHDFCVRREPSWLDETGKIVWQNGEARLGFGKYKGRTVRELVLDDPDYVEWIIREDFPEDTRAILRNALGGIFPERPQEMGS